MKTVGLDIHLWHKCPEPGRDTHSNQPLRPGSSDIRVNTVAAASSAGIVPHREVEIPR